MANLKDLYAEYGRLMIQMEILNNQTLEIKRQIVEELNKQSIPVEEKQQEEKK
jgi:hypothetical protein